MEHNSWLRFGAMIAVSFIAMYVLMYTMVWSWEDFHPSLSQAYMAGSMTAAMVVIELVLMGSMYKNATVRNALIGVGVLALVATVAFTRYQTGIGDKDFLRSMIPHHSGAILMCSNPKLEDPEIRTLCQSIIKGQQQEIDEMHAILNRK
jgi:uncharacterized protein (DUF305 family)